MIRLLRLDKAGANTVKIKGGGGVTGDDALFYANIIDEYPRFTLYGNSHFRIAVPPGASMQIYEGSSPKLFEFKGSAMHMLETTTPTPIANYAAIYSKNDNELYFQTGAGLEKTVTTV